MGTEVDRIAVRIASSPNARIAVGLLIAVLLSVVGYQVVRRLNSHGPEALLKRADDVSWLVDAVQIEPYLSTEQKLHLLSEVAHLMAASAPLFAVIKGSVPSPSYDSIVDLLLAPVLVWRQSTLSRRPVSSQ